MQRLVAGKKAEESIEKDWKNISLIYSIRRQEQVEWRRGREASFSQRHLGSVVPKSKLNALRRRRSNRCGLIREIVNMVVARTQCRALNMLIQVSVKLSDGIGAKQIISIYRYSSVAHTG